MSETKTKIWGVSVFFFFLVLGISSFLLSIAITGHFYTELEYFKSDIFARNSGPKVIVSIVSVTTVFFALFVTESTTLTSVFSSKLSRLNKYNWLSVIGIAGIISASIFLAYNTYYAIELRLDAISTSNLLRGGSESHDVIISNTDYFAIIFSGIYPFLLFSIPYCLHYFSLLTRGNNFTQVDLNSKCKIGVISLFFIIPTFVGITQIIFNIISLPFTEMTGAMSIVLGFRISEFSSYLYILIFSSLGIILVHNISIKTIKNWFNDTSIVTISTFILFLIFLVGAYVLHQARESIIMEDMATRAILQGGTPLQPPKKSTLDSILFFVLTNLIFLSVLLGGYITRITRCMLRVNGLSTKCTQHI